MTQLRMVAGALHNARHACQASTALARAHDGMDPNGADLFTIYSNDNPHVLRLGVLTLRVRVLGRWLDRVRETCWRVPA